MFDTAHPKRPSSAFTILEIIIVVVIIGVLTSLAIPRFAAMVERARVTEAISMLTQIRSNFERCYVMNGRNYDACLGTGPAPNDMFSLIGLDNPTNSPNSHFSYPDTATKVNLNYTINANRNTYELMVTDVGGEVNCAGGLGGGPTSGVLLCITPTSVGILGWGIYEGINTMPR